MALALFQRPALPTPRPKAIERWLLAVACLVFGGAQVLVSTFVSPILGGITVAVLCALVLRISPKGFSRC